MIDLAGYVALRFHEFTVLRCNYHDFLLAQLVRHQFQKLNRDGSSLGFTVRLTWVHVGTTAISACLLIKPVFLSILEVWLAHYWVVRWRFMLIYPELRLGFWFIACKQPQRRWLNDVLLAPNVDSLSSKPVMLMKSDLLSQTLVVNLWLVRMGFEPMCIFTKYNFISNKTP